MILALGARPGGVHPSEWYVSGGKFGGSRSGHAGLRVKCAADLSCGPPPGSRGGGSRGGRIPTPRERARSSSTGSAPQGSAR